MGRDNRNRWVFVNHPAKQPLDVHEVRFWKKHLEKILKVGLEFEYNLPNKNGRCKGTNNACPCSMMSKASCWSECVRRAECERERGKGFECHGIYCSQFETICITCDRFKVDCMVCDQRYDPQKNPNAIRERMKSALHPSNSYGMVNKSGVHSIETDGSLLGEKGAEVITVGRRVDFWEFFRMSKEIIDLALINGAFVNERCSIHAHVLGAYYGKIAKDRENGPGVHANISELERTLPEIILANFHQLCRRYQNAMTWMTMGLDDPNHLTRWEKFRVSVLEISAILNSMPRVKEEVSSNAGGNKYGWVNYNNIGFDENGDVSRLHVEMRACDGLMSPSAVAALACMYFALMIKAVEISRYGVVEVGDEAWMNQAREVKKAILNNMKNYQDGDRFGYTENLPKYYDILIGESLDLVGQLKHILMTCGPAYEILEKLAERPCALRRLDGHTWNDIERDLAVQLTAEDLFHTRLSEVIDMRIVDKCMNEVEWIKEVGNILKNERDLGIDPDDATVEDRIGSYVGQKKRDGEVIWLDRVGTMAFV